MTRTETRFLQRLILFLVIAALCPLGAFAYRIALNAAPDAVPNPAPIFTMVPAVGDIGLATPEPTTVVVVVPNGWTQHTLTEQGFALAIPTTWQRLPVKSQELAAALETVRQSNPELANALGANAEALLQSGVKFWAIDLTPETQQAGFATNVTVTRQTLPNSVSFDTFVSVNLNQLDALTTRNSDIVNERVSLAGQPAERVRYLLALNRDQDSPMTAAITQYLVLNGRDAYVLTYSTRNDLVNKYRSVFDTSAASLRFIGK
ncbi:MAG: hypothetical protein HY741_14485 [Chloroflexi bacterium]|nr:hypothetical protein [Chloroflexota bacterium]